MNDHTILRRVHELVEEEHRLRQSTAGVDVAERLATIEQELDQCWDLLRQRRGKSEFGDNPDEAVLRDTRTVESYRG